MSTERFNLAAGIRPTHVAFKGQPEMIVEIVTGRVHFGIPSLGPAMPFLKDGRLIPLAVNTQKRSPHLPEVPALIEIVPAFERDAAHALMAPAKTPTWIVQKIAQDVARVLDMPDVKERMYAIRSIRRPLRPKNTIARSADRSKSSRWLRRRSG